MTDPTNKVFVLVSLISLSFSQMVYCGDDFQNSNVRDIRSANLGEEYNHDIFENFQSENSPTSPVMVQPSFAPSIYYSGEAAKVALESERAIENKIVTRLETAITNYHEHISKLTPRRIEFLRGLLHILPASEQADTEEDGTQRLFVMLPNLIREFPDKLHDFAEVLGPNCKIIVLVGTEFEEEKAKRLIDGLPITIQIVPMREDNFLAIVGTSSEVGEISLIGLPKDDAFSDRLKTQLESEIALVHKKILSPNSPMFDLIGKNGQFAIILRVAWYAAVSF